MDSKGILAAKNSLYMSMMSINTRPIVEFRVRVCKEGDYYWASVEELPLEVWGGTAKEASEILVESFRDWAYERVSAGNLEETLMSVGYSDIGDDTEIHLVITLEDD
jgi:hypothetical protein